MTQAIPIFETERLFLAPPRLEDAEAYTRHFVDWEVIAPLSAVVPWPYPEGGVELHLRTQILPHLGQNRWAWGLFLKQTLASPLDPRRELIGAVELFRGERPDNRGFWLGRRFWGQGLMTEALLPITDFAFESLGFERLVVNNAVGNLRSRRLKEKAGAKLIAVEAERFVDPRYTEKEVWSLERADWLAHRPEQVSLPQTPPLKLS
ncbi:MAG: GNAT family N-acetyltransferase [Myxococcota bacterium]|nr:GNAT family N-acetyltransferase [Myxococcota bacterium]